MKFYWNFHYDLLDKIKTYPYMKYENGTYVGCCRIGNLCWDIVINKDRNNKKKSVLTAELFVGGVDRGYGKSEHGYPFDYDDDGYYIMDIDADIEKMKEYAEDFFSGYIANNGYEYADLKELAEGALNIW